MTAHHTHAAEQQGVAVRPGAGHGLGADIAGGAGAVLDDDGLLELAAQAGGEDARDDVAAAGEGTMR